MLKSELLEKLKDIDDNADINETILSIEDFAKSSKFDVTKVTVEDYKNMLANNKEISGYYQSTLDSQISKAVNSHDEKFKKEKLPKLIADGIKQQTEKDLTPEQKELKELKEQMQQLKAEKQANELLSSNRNKLKEAKLNEDLAKYIKEDSDIEFFKNLINTSVDNGVKEKINNASYVPPANTNVDFEDGVEKAFFDRTGVKL